MTEPTSHPDDQDLQEDNQWSVCTICGAVVALSAVHATWHNGPAEPIEE